jgi:HlyD family secretion protein
VQSAEAKAEEARVNLAYTEIRSPVDGVVVSRNVSPGQTVAASFQTPTLFTVAADLTRMEVSANVSESDIGGVAVGQDVTFTVDAWPNDVFHGTVAQVRNAPITVQNVVTYDVLVRVDNHELKLKPGMTANVTIVTAKRDDVLRVPTAALRFRPPSDATTEEPRPGTRVVWQPDDDGRATAVPVAIGVNDDRWTELVRGLDAGAPVVVGIARDPDEGAERPLLPFGASPPRHRR